MAESTQLVEFVTAGDTGDFGSSQIINFVLGVAATGFISLAAPVGNVSGGESGRLAALDLSVISSWENRLDLNPDKRPVVPAELSQSEFAEFSVENATDGVFAITLFSESFGLPKISGNLSGRSVKFDLDSVKNATAFTRLNFGGPDVVVGLSTETLDFGQTLVEAPISLAPEGYSTLRLGSANASRGQSGRDVTLNLLSLPYGTLPAQLNLSGPFVGQVTGAESFVAGSADVENTSLGIFPVSVKSTIPPFKLSRDVLGRDIQLDLLEVFPGIVPVQLNISGPAVGQPVAGDFFASGDAAVVNVSLGVFPTSVVSQYPKPTVSIDTPARWVVFDLVEPIPVRNPGEVLFRAGGLNRAARFDLGLHSFESGNTLVETPPVILPDGWDSLEIGGLGRFIWLAYPQGLDSFAVGPYSSIGIPGQVFGQGSQVTVFGTPDLPKIVFAGMHRTAWGQTFMEAIEPPGLKILELPSFSSTEIGTTFISNYWRVLDFDGLGAVNTSWGEDRLSLSPQYAYMPFDHGFFEPGALTVGFGIEIQMVGVPAFSRFGLAIIDHARIFPTSVFQTNWGTPLLKNQDQAMSFSVGLRETQWGLLGVSTDQIIEIEYDCTEIATRCGVEFSRYTLVENFNQLISAQGFHSLRMEFFPLGVTRVGKALQVSGFTSLEFVPHWQGSHLVAYRNRSFVVGNYESLIFPSWSRLKNTARVLDAEGKQGTGFGLPDAERLLQLVFMWGVDSSQVSAIERTSFSPRTFDLKYPISSLQINQPFVAYGSRYLAPSGFDSFQWAGWEVTGKPVPTLSPRWMQLWTQDQQLIGLPEIENFNKQFWPAGLLATQIPVRSAYWISHSPRFLMLTGLDVTIYGRTVIADRTKVFELEGLEETNYSRGHILWHDPPVIFPAFDTAIFPVGFQAAVPTHNLGFGKFGEWGFLENVLRVNGLRSFTEGAGKVHSNGIIFEQRDNPIGGYTTFGENHLLSGGEREVAPERIEEQVTSWGLDNGALYVGTFVVSPYTVWCTHDAPAQAIDNHPPHKRWCDVDQFCKELGSHPFVGHSIGSNRSGPWFGEDTRVDAKVTQILQVTWNSHLQDTLESRYLFVSGNAGLTFGTNIFEPKSMLLLRLGYPDIRGDVTRNVRVEQSIQMTAYGEYAVENSLRYLGPFGISSLVVPACRIENFHRSLLVTGLDATIYGDNHPMVHFPRTVTPVDSDLMLFGVQWVSHSPRYFEAGDNDFFVSEWVEHSLRMFVYSTRWIVRGYRFNEFTEFGDMSVQTGITRVAPYSAYTLCVSPWYEVKNVIV